MWPHMGAMGWWMASWWLFGIVVLILFARILARAAAGPHEHVEVTPGQILKRRYANGELEHDEYERRLTDLRR